MPDYKVNSPLLHNKKEYGNGDTVTMDKEQASTLLDQGVLTGSAVTNLAEEMTVPKLTEALGKLNVDIPPGAKKADLVELYNKATITVNDTGKQV